MSIPSIGSYLLLHLTIPMSLRPVKVYTYNDALTHIIDGSIYFYDLVEGKVDAKIEAAHRKPVTCIAYHPFQHSMMSASFDGTIKTFAPLLP